MKKTATEKISKACVAKKLTRMSTSKLWELTNGAVVYVTTPNTSRASDLMHVSCYQHIVFNSFLL